MRLDGCGLELETRLRRSFQLFMRQLLATINIYKKLVNKLVFYLLSFFVSFCFFFAFLYLNFVLNYYSATSCFKKLKLLLTCNFSCLYYISLFSVTGQEEGVQMVSCVFSHLLDISWQDYDHLLLRDIQLPDYLFDTIISESCDSHVIF